jgi:phage shock protein C
MSIADELAKLEGLRASGALNEEEFARAKALVLSGMPAAPPDVENILRKFTRSSRDKWLGGVCGGLAAQTPVPSWAWRLGFCLLLFAYGVGLIPYILLWIFVPSDDRLI